MSLRSDIAEAATGTLVGIPTSAGLTVALRWIGLWDAPWWAITAIFAAVSFAMRLATRRLFRRAAR